MCTKPYANMASTSMLLYTNKSKFLMVFFFPDLNSSTILFFMVFSVREILQLTGDVIAQVRILVFGLHQPLQLAWKLGGINTSPRSQGSVQWVE